MTDIFKYWPMPEHDPRWSQTNALEFIQDLPAHIKYVLCEIPVGGGKSPLALNYSGWISKTMGNGFICTTQKVLQKQYEDSFDKQLLSVVYGKSNYECKSKGTDCDVGSTLKPPCDKCPAKLAYDKGVASPNMVLNYHLALLYFSIFGNSDKLPKREVMVFDECHTLETQLTEFNAVEITKSRCDVVHPVTTFHGCDTLGKAITWLKDSYYSNLVKYMEKLAQNVERIKDEMDSGRPLNKIDSKSLREYFHWVKHLDAVKKLMFMDMATVNKRYVLVHDKNMIKFKELYGSNVFKNLVEPMANKFLFMSSTILNKDEFCKDLGLNPDEAAFITLPSEFDVDNRPVMYKPTTKMNYGWDDANRASGRKKMIDNIVEVILSEHIGMHGIIHTGNYRIAEWLVDNLPDVLPHNIIHHNPKSGVSRDSAIDEFVNMPKENPSILISPSITEGLDLVGDKGRFAIFTKVPYPYLGDQWVKKRMNISKEWYNRQAMIAIIQGGGRIVRSKDDWGYTYILDESFGYLLSQCRDYMPKWWLEGFIKL